MKGALSSAAIALAIVACARSATAPPPVIAAAPTPPARPAWQARAASYLDARSRDWIEHTPQIGENFTCALSCHTTHSFLLARASLPGGEEAMRLVRAPIEARVAAIPDGWAGVAGYYGRPGTPLEARSLGSEAVMNAATLALHDAARGVTLAASTRRAIDLMWQRQRADGGWDWMSFDLEPWESSEDWGAALAAVVVGSVHEDARAEVGDHVDRLASRLRARLAQASLHDRATMLWGASAWRGLLEEPARDAIVRDLVAAERPGGGWSLASWGRGKLADPKGAPDGYATALATLALCEAHASPDAVARGKAWLVASQRADGAWPGRSVNEDAELHHRFMTDAATAYATLALIRCAPR